MARIITITSGEDGVGKTSVSLNLSLSLALEGFKVCLFDADFGLSNINIFTGIYPKKNLESVISGQSSLNDIIIKNYHGIDIIPGSSGVKKITDLTQAQAHTLVKAFVDLEDYDYFILDTSWEMSSQVLSFCMASSEIILVATCEPTSLTNAYSMLKMLSKHQYELPVKVVINQAISDKSAKKAYDQLKELVNKFLSIKIQPLGIVALDKNVRAAIVSQKPFVILFPDTIASKCINSITRKLINKAGQIRVMPLELFWDKCLAFLKKHHKPEKKPVSQKSDVKNNKEQDPDIKKALFNIESRLSTLIKEVSDIKQSLETQRAQSNKSKEKELKPPVPNEISLDFESWLKKKYN
ncbi:MAG: AAA family ATPase [Deltaproteobacteria bacterium]|uniref:AAA family ATPase n=1 Tax=Desulfobacula sp. TaxID=2593537 RepID=UPI00199635F0|nr:AAA family ATPase [Candidatus Desulfobacula maris]MBL6993081.1 AAA family ATPase [Desulfobacula sp.]